MNTKDNKEMTMTITRAQWDAAFAGDGQRWTTIEGERMVAYMVRYGMLAPDLADHEGVPDGAYDLEDGAVVVAGGGWDYQARGCVCGGCWEGAGVRCGAANDSDEVSR